MIWGSFRPSGVGSGRRVTVSIDEMVKDIRAMFTEYNTEMLERMWQEHGVETTPRLSTWEVPNGRRGGWN